VQTKTDVNLVFALLSGSVVAQPCCWYVSCTVAKQRYTCICDLSICRERFGSCWTPSTSVYQTS